MKNRTLCDAPKTEARIVSVEHERRQIVKASEERVRDCENKRYFCRRSHRSELWE